MSGSGGGSRGYTSPENISPGAKTYDPKEARKLLEGDLERRVITYAEIKHGKGKEVAAEFKTENYREGPNKDPLDVLDEVCGKPEVLEAEVVDSIDDVVKCEEPKPNMLKVVMKGTKNLIHKTCWYYPFLGALSGKKQEELAKKYGDNPIHYTVSNLLVEPIVVGGGAWYFSGDPLSILPIGFVYFLASLLNKGARGNFQKPVGDLVVELPIYAAENVKNVKSAVKDAYVSAFQQEQQSLRLRKESGEFKILPVRPILLPPPPHLKTAEKEEALSQIETSARIEESPEIVPDEELEDFDKSLRERTGAL